MRFGDRRSIALVGAGPVLEIGRRGVVEEGVAKVHVVETIRRGLGDDRAKLGMVETRQGISMSEYATSVQLGERDPNFCHVCKSVEVAMRS